MKEVPLEPAVTPVETARLRRLQGTALPFLLLSLAVWLPYGHVLANRLMFDDRDTILRNKTIEEMSNVRLLFSRKEYFQRFDEYSYRPVVTFSYFLDHAVAGKRPWIYHLHNLVLHHLNVLLAFGLFSLLGAGRLRAFAIALVFALHPLGSEAVIFPGFREDLQMTAGMLVMSCCMALDRERPSFFWLAGAALAYSYALFAKEAALLLPAAWLAFDVIYDRHVLQRVRLGRRYFLLAVVLIGYVAIRFVVMANPGAAKMDVIERLPLAQRLLTAPGLFAYYLKRFFWPMPLCILNDIQPVHEMGAAFHRAVAAVAVFAVVWIVLAWGRPWLWLAGFWIAATFAPVSNLYPIVNLWAERFYYSVNLGTAAIVVMGIGALFRAVGSRLPDGYRRKGAIGAWTAAVGIVWLAAMGDFVRVLECRTPLSLWRATHRRFPESGIALRNLARCELEAHHFKEAERLAQKAEHREGGGIWAANFIIGRSAFLQGQWKRAILYFEKAREVDAPSVENQTSLLRSLGYAYMKVGQKRNAQLRLREALEWDPKDETARALLKRIEAKQKDEPSSASANSSIPDSP